MIHAEEVPLQSFERNPMNPGTWLLNQVPGPANQPDWQVTPGSPGGTVTVTEMDSHYGVQSLLLSGGAAGLQSKLELIGRLPLAEFLPGFVDFWVRPTTWGGTATGNNGSPAPNNGTPTPYNQGTQVFVDGHYFSFFRTYLNGPLRLYYHEHQPTAAWRAGLPNSVLVPVIDASTWGADVIARDWVRFTARVDPVTQKADVWLNGRLVITDASRSPAYSPPFLAPSFYVQSSSNGPFGFDDFQLTSTNPLFPDMDRDGLPDSWELEHGLDISIDDRAADLDGDGLSNLRELILRTLPEDADSDDDQMPDGWEVLELFDPLFDRDARQDADLDGSSNSEEYAAGSDPRTFNTAPPRDVVYVAAVDPDEGIWWNEDGTYEGPFTTLQLAVDWVADGGTIVVLNTGIPLRGSGNSNVYISHPLTIKGNGEWVSGWDESFSYAADPGIYVSGADVTIEELNFDACYRWEGGAVFAEGISKPDMSLILRGCQFNGCQAADDGGAVRLVQVASGTIADCQFVGCFSGDKGGGLSAEGSSLNVRRCRFEYNIAQGDGGGAHFKNCSGVLENGLFNNNGTAADGGAAVFKSGTSMVLSYVSAIRNDCSGQGAAFYNSSPAPLTLTSSILWGNTVQATGTVTANTQVAGLWTARYTTAQLQTLGSTNSQADPLLHDGWWTLRPASPAIDAGDPLAIVEKDLEGTIRQLCPGHTGSSAADRGCFEFADSDGDGMSDKWERKYYWMLNPYDAGDVNADYDGDGFTNYEEYLANTDPGYAFNRPAGAVLYVDPRTNFGNDAWAGTYYAPVQSIKRAIELCTTLNGSSTTTRICLRDGIYKGTPTEPDLNKNLSTGLGTTASPGKKFYLKSINGKGRVTIDLENSGRFLTIENPGFDGSCGLEGLTIRRGKSAANSGHSNPGNGGAILVTASSTASQPFIAKCSLVGCNATIEGGAVFVLSGSLFLFETELFANEAWYGGAISVHPLASSQAVYALRCTLSYNYASGFGGAVFSTGVLRWKDTTVFCNVASAGAAVFLENTFTPGQADSTYTPGGVVSSGTNASFRTAAGYSNSPTLFNSAFGGAKPALSGCTLVENSSWSASDPEETGGGALSVLNSGANFERLVIERNRIAGSSWSDGGGVWIYEGWPTFRACIFRGNETTGNGGGAAGGGDETFFANCAFCDNTAAGEGGALHLPDWLDGGWVELNHCTATHNRSTTHAISCPGECHAFLLNSLVWFNRMHADPGLTSGTPALLDPNAMLGSNGNNLELLLSGNVSFKPSLAWDHYHLLTSVVPAGTPVAQPRLTLDIDGELRANTTANTPERGCDEWTDTDADGVPDWYARIIADMSPDDTITLSTGSVAGLLLWGVAGPTVMQVFQAGLDPAANPATNDADEDGLTNAEELTEFGTDPNSNNSAGGNLTDAQLVGRGNTVDTDGDGVFDDLEALPLRKDYRWPKAPAPTAYVPIALGANTYAMGVTHGGKILLQDRSSGQPDWQRRLFIVSQEAPTPAPAARNWLPYSNSSNDPQMRLPGNLFHNNFSGPKIADDGDDAAVLDHYYNEGLTQEFGGISYGANEFFPLYTDIGRPSYLPEPFYPSSIWDDQYVESSYLWLNHFGEVYGYLKWENGEANDEFDIDEDNDDEEGESSARILMRWTNAGSAPEELTIYANPPQHGNPLPTHEVLGDTMNQTQDDPPGLAQIWAVSPGGAVLYYETETQPVEFYGNQYLVTPGNDRFLLEKPLTMSLATYAYDVFDFPTSSNPAQGEIIGPVAVGNYQGNAVSPAATVLWERTRSPNGGALTAPKRKTLPVYPATGDASELGQIIIREISPKGEILFTDDFTYIAPYPNYHSLWRNGEVVDLNQIAGRPDGIPIDDPATIPLENGHYRAIGFGKDGAIVANLFVDGNVQAVILLPVEVVELSPHVPNEQGTAMEGSQRVSSGRALTPFVEVLQNVTHANRIAYRELNVKIGTGNELSGRTVTWSLIPIPGATPANIRGQLQDSPTHTNQFEASAAYAGYGGAGGVSNIVNGHSAIRVNIPPIGRNKARIRIRIQDFDTPLNLLDMEVPAVVVVDPGHGGGSNLEGSKSNNATAQPSGILEKNMTLDYGRALRLALLTKSYADALPTRVFATRRTDINHRGDTRAFVARNQGADVFQSIHFNAFNGIARGTETWVRRPVDNVNTPEDRALAVRVLARLFAAVHAFDTNTANRGVKPHATDPSAFDLDKAELAVLSDASYSQDANYHPIRSTLAEIEFIDVPAVDVLLNTGNNAVPIRNAVVNGIRDAIFEDLVQQPAQ